MDKMQTWEEYRKLIDPSGIGSFIQLRQAYETYLLRCAVQESSRQLTKDLHQLKNVILHREG